ncbi:MAG: DUF1638 domain-containing protein [Deltaproteobacteria bacterium]|nr:DUF1638 domain-containing protein [Deltaproteobacteria bacterium]
MNSDRTLLIGCGILEKEIRRLIEINRWAMDTFFLDSALHVNFAKLEKSLTAALKSHQGKKIIVFYGCCHPLMDRMLEEAHTFRTEGQNCVDMLLGHDRFSDELSKGAFFLLEDWARHWDHMTKIFKNEEILKDIFRGDRKYLLGVRTVCSEDFSAEAEKAGKMVGLPVRWMDVSLDHLESVLRAAIKKGSSANIADTLPITVGA